MSSLTGGIDMNGRTGGFMPGAISGRPESGEKEFAKIEALLETMGGITLSQVCTVTGLEATTIQNWVKRGWVAHPLGKKYEERHIARILLINALKECFKLENIASLLSYVNNCDIGESSEVYIKESELYNYLQQALKMLGQSDDLSRSGIESIVDKVIALYDSPNIDAHMRIRKALTVMIYACVCTNVKRGTEAMMQQILDEYEHADFSTVRPEETQITIDESPPSQPDMSEILQDTEEIAEIKKEAVVEARKTIAQALREWEEISASEEEADDEAITEIVEKSSKTWLSRMGLGNKDTERDNLFRENNEE